ncbi:hypothetical protein ACFFUT_09100 [Pseudohalocynthiibacter aestuariivivens]|uniref:HNH nuclease domain-containing protein n=1 Tax=Pseudohalocynthiibacter aestuariivivens TaxID=1591409 RepID=A0ABV5JES9_9RHOB|nr:hypothetical protein [Pseudohalocynthiibacter aestuariivivens]MBS9716937.1 hypothetical protein [Pseudohalocynthiibacter aestuariivivens]
MNEPEKSRRFHVAECDTLETMRNAGRFERYVVTNRTDGAFLVDWRNSITRERGEVEARLKVCKNCLNAINWRGYARAQDRLRQVNGNRQSKKAVWESFDISEFLLDYSTFFTSKPSRHDITASPNVYVTRWAAISEELRRLRGWRCEACGVNLSTLPGLLHCHHKNGVVTDNNQKNLMVLCSIDHAKQPNHQHMKVSRQHQMLIMKLRAEQGLIVPGDIEAN